MTNIKIIGYKEFVKLYNSGCIVGYSFNHSFGTDASPHLGEGPTLYTHSFEDMEQFQDTASATLETLVREFTRVSGEKNGITLLESMLNHKRNSYRAAGRSGGGFSVDQESKELLLPKEAFAYRQVAIKDDPVLETSSAVVVKAERGGLELVYVRWEPEIFKKENAAILRHHAEKLTL